MRADESAFILSGKSCRPAMVKEIKSKDNLLYKKLLALRSAVYARKHELVVIEGPRHTLDVLESGFIPDWIFFSDDSKGEEAYRMISGSLEARGKPFEEERLIRLPYALFRRASVQKTPQGVMAIVPFRVGRLASFLDSQGGDLYPSRLLVLEAIQDPGNVGTLIRTADAFSFDGVILTDSCASVWNPKTVSASMGSLFHLPLLEETGGVRPALSLLKQAGFEILASGFSGEDLAEAESFKPRLALILGNEGSGLSAEAFEEADRLLRIHMPGKAESLNVASAGAILLWEIVRRQRSRTGLV